MGLTAEYEITCGCLPLVTVAALVPEATVEVEIKYNHGDRPPFIVHVSHEDITEVECAFESAAFVAEYTLVGQIENTYRYQVLPAVGEKAQLGAEIDDLSGLRSLATTDAIIDRIYATPTGWIQSGWFANRATLDEFRTFWQQNGAFALRRLTYDDESDEDREGLTKRQHEAVQTAYEMGYFEIPRSASLDDVAAELSITASSLSERLRRAQTHLIETGVNSREPIID
jgi:hypothetical protein